MIARILVLVTLTAGGCVQVYEEPSTVAAVPEYAYDPYYVEPLVDDDYPGELYRDESIYDDDVGVLDYYLIPPGL